MNERAKRIAPNYLGKEELALQIFVLQKRAQVPNVALNLTSADAKDVALALGAAVRSSGLVLVVAQSEAEGFAWGGVVGVRGRSAGGVGAGGKVGAGSEGVGWKGRVGEGVVTAGDGDDAVI
jgi:hypothetical protein